MLTEATVLMISRHSHGTMHRLPRVSPNAALQFNEWTIPAGVSVEIRKPEHHGLTRHLGSRGHDGVPPTYRPRDFPPASSVYPRQVAIKRDTTDDTQLRAVFQRLPQLPRDEVSACRAMGPKLGLTVRVD